MLFVLLAVLLLAATTEARGCAAQRKALRGQLLNLHKKAARCPDTDEKCVGKVFGKIAKVRKALSKLRNKTCKSSRTACVPGTTFERFLTEKRERISRMAQKCRDEDDGCIKQAMNLLVALNSDVDAQKRIWKNACSPAMKAIQRSPKTPKIKVSQWVPRSVWTHEFTCKRMKAGFRLWLASQQSRRRTFHKESQKCPPADLACIRMNFQSIIHIQRAIQAGRTLFADRMSTCDRCAKIKLRWSRWLLRQREKRQRLQLSACRCADSDSECLTEAVTEIKKIQAEIKKRRTEALNLHGKCRMSDGSRFDAGYVPAPTTAAADLSDL